MNNINNIIKRSFSTLLVIALLVSLAPSGSFAQETGETETEAAAEASLYEGSENSAEQPSEIVDEQEQAEEEPSSSNQTGEPAAEEAATGDESVSEEAEGADTEEKLESVPEEPEQTEEPREISTVKVLFTCEELEDLSGLYVYNANGVALDPYYDTARNEFLFDTYYLAPGDYTYSIHDENGDYQDLSDVAFSVTAAAEEQSIVIMLEEAEKEDADSDVEIYSLTVVNPIYTDVIKESDIPKAAITDAQIAGILTAEQSAQGSISQAQLYTNGSSTSTTSTIHTTTAAAGAELKQYLKARNSEIRIYLELSGSHSWSTLCTEVYSAAVAHTGVPTEGDYLYYEYGGYNATGATTQNSSTNTYTYLFIYTPLYYTTAAQERTMTSTVNSIISQLDLSNKTDYQKIKAIYDYLCTHVTYDYANLNDSSYTLKYTGYAALVNNTAVCQGYSVAFYRLCLEAGIDARLMSSKSMCHAWNIVRYLNNYYELDSTWDAGNTSYSYFLKGSTWWCTNHKTLGDEFSNSSFAATYSVPASDAPIVHILSYDANGGTGVPDAQEKTLSEDITISSTVPARDGFTFLGWATSSDSETVAYKPGDIFTADEDTVLYAVWKDDSRINENTVWENTSSAYNLKWDISVASGTTLTIADGVTVNGNGHKITVFGTLSAAGAKLNNLIIESGSNSSDALSAGITISNCTVNGGALSFVYPAAIEIRNNSFADIINSLHISDPSSETYITGNTFAHCAGINIASSSNVYISNNLFYDHSYTDYVIENEGQTNGSVCCVENNSFYDNGIILRLSGASAAMSASNNYWFSTDTDKISERIYDSNDDSSIGAVIEFVPYLTSPDSSTPVKTGAAHSLSHQESINPTCEENGQIDCYFCSNCKHYFYDESCTNEVPESQPVILEALGHDFNSESSIGICTRCGQTDEINAFSGTCGDNAEWLLDSSGILTISGSGRMNSWMSADTVPWYEHMSSIRSVVIGSEITSVGSMAFSGSSAASITLPDGLKAIGQQAFSSCTALISILLPATVSQIDALAFEDCNSLNEIIFKGSSPAIDGTAFSNVTADVYTQDKLSSSWSGAAGNNYSGSLNWISYCCLDSGNTPVIDHTPETLPAVAATEANDGLTEGEKCSECGLILAEQKTVPATGWPITYILNNERAVNSSSNPERYYKNSKSISLASPAAELYTFDGWYLDEALTRQSTPPQITRNSKGEKTFYAKWTPISYSIKFAANGGSGSTAALSNKSDLSGELSAVNKFKRTGYTFDGWNTKADGTGESFSNVFTVYELAPYAVNKVITLYAQWAPVSYTVSFEANGGAGAMEPMTFTYGTAQNLPVNTFEKTGYIFNGWKNGSKTYRDGQSVSNLSTTDGAEIVLTAQWTANKNYEGYNYTIRFDGNGSTGGKMADEAMKVGTARALSYSGFTKTGYHFIGWSTKADGEIDYTNRQSVKDLNIKYGQNTVTLYAVWEANTYSVTFNGNGGYLMNGTRKVTTCKQEETFTYDTASFLDTNRFERTGYTFKEWNTKANGSGTGYADEAEVSKLTASNNGRVTLYAIWEYKVSFYPGAGEGNAFDKKLTYNCSELVDGADFRKSGYYLAGWNKNEANALKGFVQYRTTAVKNAGPDAVLYAVWKPCTYTIVFNTNGGTGRMNNLAMTYNMAKILTSNAFKFTGHTFLGWSRDQTANTAEFTNKAKITNEIIPEYNKQVIDLYAIWR